MHFGAILSSLALAVSMAVVPCRVDKPVEFVKPMVYTSELPQTELPKVPYRAAFCEPKTPGKYLGAFKCYAYCGCYACNGKWTGYPTALGTDYEHGRTLAVDPDVIPLGTELYLEGYGWFVAEDTGTGIDGFALDMYYDSHSDALEHGIKRVEVWTNG